MEDSTDGTARPVVRLWEISGIDAADLALLAVLEDEALPRIAELPGYLGSYLLRDLAEDRIVTLSFWADLEALAASDEASRRVPDAFEVLTSASGATRSRFDVIGNRPPPAGGTDQ